MAKLKPPLALRLGPIHCSQLPFNTKLLSEDQSKHIVVYFRSDVVSGRRCSPQMGFIYSPSISQAELVTAVGIINPEYGHALLNVPQQQQRLSIESSFKWTYSLRIFVTWLSDISRPFFSVSIPLDKVHSLTCRHASEIEHSLFQYVCIPATVMDIHNVSFNCSIAIQTYHTFNRSTM